MSNKVWFYDNINKNNSKDFPDGEYNSQNIFSDGWKPVIAKIAPLTTLILKSDKVNSYVNSYPDISVLIQIPNINISGFTIERYIPNPKHESASGFKSYRNIMYIIGILIIFLILLLYFKYK
jgi:hypothetical protein